MSQSEKERGHIMSFVGQDEVELEHMRREMWRAKDEIKKLKMAAAHDKEELARLTKVNLDLKRASDQDGETFVRLT